MPGVCWFEWGQDSGSEFLRPDPAVSFASARTTARELGVSIASQPPGNTETLPLVTQRSLRSMPCRADPDSFCAKAPAEQMTSVRIANARLHMGAPSP